MVTPLDPRSMQSAQYVFAVARRSQDAELRFTLAESARLMPVNASPYARQIERKRRPHLLKTGSRKARRYT